MMSPKLAAALLASAAIANAADLPSGSEAEAVRSAIANANPAVKVLEPRSTPVSGLYQTSLDGTRGYVTADGRYFIVGDMYEVATRRNLSEESRRSARRAALEKIDDNDAIVFSPAQVKHRVTVFTDVDCGYCRKLHSEIAKYNELGIAVRYVAYPRSGPDTESWSAMEAVWCSKDRRDAITRAKLGEKIEKPAACSTTLVAAHYALGNALGMQGTPMILLDDGRSVDGYAPPLQLAQLLDKPLKDASAARASP